MGVSGLSLREVRWDRDRRSAHLRNQTELLCRWEAVGQSVYDFCQRYSLLPNDKVFVILGFRFHANGSTRNLVTRHSSLVTRLPVFQVPAKHSFELSNLGRENFPQIFALFRRHAPLVRNNIAIFIALHSQTFHAEKVED